MVEKQVKKTDDRTIPSSLVQEYETINIMCAYNEKLKQF